MDARITILGLGPGEARLVTRQVWEILESTPELYLRTRMHPAVAGLPPGIRIHSFDDLYDQVENYDSLYDEISSQILALAHRDQGVVYAVPGDPHVAEATTELIKRRAAELGIPVEVHPGLSFLEPVFRALSLDPLPQSALVDALSLAAEYHPSFPPSYPALVAQVYDRGVAAEVKLTLMQNYPDDHPVVLVHGAGTDEERTEPLPLYEIDRSDQTGPLTCLFVPPLAGRVSFESFQELIAHLRSPEGCPWDREQTHLSLRTYLLEETYEILEALDRQDPDSLMEELGDLLIQIVLHAQIATEEGDFSMVDVIRTVSDKLVYRHPHVFAEADLRDAASVKENWEKLKRAEREQSGSSSAGALHGVPEALPALAVADAYGSRAASRGFDWPDVDGVIAKIEEELREVLLSDLPAERANEIGDLFFAVANLARWYGLDSESLLREANARFRWRFEALEKRAAEMGRLVSDLSIEEMDEIWEETKGRQE